MNATQQAYEQLESKREGLYGELIEAVLDLGGYLIQTPGYFAAFHIKDGEAHVLYACGNMRELLRYAADNADALGIESVGWERGLVGKHEDYKRYTLNQLCRRK